MGIWNELNHDVITESSQAPASICDSPHDINLLYKNNYKFKLFHHNIRGIRKNFDYYYYYFIVIVNGIYPQVQYNII